MNMIDRAGAQILNTSEELIAMGAIFTLTQPTVSGMGTEISCIQELSAVKVCVPARPSTSLNSFGATNDCAVTVFTCHHPLS